MIIADNPRDFFDDDGFPGEWGSAIEPHTITIPAGFEFRKATLRKHVRSMGSDAFLVRQPHFQATGTVQFEVQWHFNAFGRIMYTLEVYAEQIPPPAQPRPRPTNSLVVKLDNVGIGQGGTVTGTVRLARPESVDTIVNLVSRTPQYVTVDPSVTVPRQTQPPRPPASLTASFTINGVMRPAVAPTTRSMILTIPAQRPSASVELTATLPSGERLWTAVGLTVVD